ncbi:MAG: ornithine carbamoyltransferase [Pirellulaceae bacterium]|nr:ornithine carbamoyltransferase [Pirellulaceae bacterium]
MSTQHVLTLHDLSPTDIREVFETSAQLKQNWAAGIREPLLSGHVMALLFEKPSLRTRVSFESCMTHLGGSSMFLGQDVGWGKRESIEDFSKVLSQYADVIVCRAFAHADVEDLAKDSSCPVINGLTDYAHPCQALADLFTIQETHGTLQGTKLAYVGDANNVARSLALGCGKLGVEFVIATPPGYEFDDAFLAKLLDECPDFQLSQTTDPREAVQGATAVYTDVWASMGQESERVLRAQAFADYQVNDQLMALAPANASFLHCLPAHRGEEVTADVIDGARSVVVQQAGNRMHVQKGLIAWLLASTR